MRRVVEACDEAAMEASGGEVIVRQVEPTKELRRVDEESRDAVVAELVVAELELVQARNEAARGEARRCSGAE
jgi:hypothetical protein